MILIHIFSLIFRLVKYILHSLFSGHSKTHKPAHIQNKRCRFFVFFFPLSDNIPDTHYKLLHSHRHLKPFWTERIPSIGVTKDKSESGKGVLRGIIDRYNWHDILWRVKIFGNETNPLNNATELNIGKSIIIGQRLRRVFHLPLSLSNKNPSQPSNSLRANIRGLHIH